jgi:hypothetical protein
VGGYVAGDVHRAARADGRVPLVFDSKS